MATKVVQLLLEDGSTNYMLKIFFINKLTNILEVTGNVKYLDKIKRY